MWNPIITTGRFGSRAIASRIVVSAVKPLLAPLAVAGFACMNVMLMSVGIWSGADGATRTLFHWLSALIGVPAIAYAGRPFFASAWSALRNWRTNMDVPISIGVALATGLSLYETVTGGHDAWFDGTLMLLLFLLAGRALDAAMRDLYDGIPLGEVHKALVLAARALIEREPGYNYVTARLQLHQIRLEVLGEEVAQGAAVGVEGAGRLAREGLEVGRGQGVEGLGHWQNLSGTSSRADPGREAVVGAERGSQQDGMRLW